MKLKRFIAIFLCSIMAVCSLTGCGGDSGKKSDAGTIYYLNFKPEVASDWEELAKKYTEETGVQMKVVTAASGNYESTLKSEIAKSDAFPNQRFGRLSVVERLLCQSQRHEVLSGAD